MTLVLFPLLYLTLELPKRIINDAIGAQSDRIQLWSIELNQVTYLMALCGLFLFFVLLHGVLKMRINTRKGVLAERLLRRLRYTLIARILRFPAPYFERTSQGELVSMITSEAEPMGGLMGDAVAQPVLQAGQMLTILGFLFAQSFVFGAAACALIPLQAWLIPKMQRQINLLNKARVIEVRALAAEIGETAAGASTLRVNGGWRYRAAMVSARLGRLFSVRFKLYRKKFFMKFTNNFIGQLTPFFFYSIGGYLVIRGEVTIGALVAALAAYKDLTGPWKELLAYYNQTQDMATRWETITERFAPEGMVDVSLIDGAPEEIPRISGDIVLHNAHVQDGDGETVLREINATFPAASTIAITAESEEDRQALCALLTRELLSTSGSIHYGTHDLRGLHQVTISRRIGFASSKPVMFRGNLGENVNMGLRTGPQTAHPDPQARAESARTGNSTDPADVIWLDTGVAGYDNIQALQQHWIALLGATKLGKPMLDRALDLDLNPSAHPELAAALVNLRSDAITKVREAGLDHMVHFFDQHGYNPALPVAENLLFAVPKVPITADVLMGQPAFLIQLDKLDFEHDLLRLAADIVDLLRQIFGVDGTDHPLFHKLGLDTTAFEAALSHVPQLRRGDTLSLRQRAELLAVPLIIPADKIGAFPASITQRVLDIRQTDLEILQDSARDLFTPISYETPIAGLSSLENVLFGKITEQGDIAALTDVLRAQLFEAGLAAPLLHQLFDLPVMLGGSNLPASLSEPLAVCRAVIKRPEVLILDQPLVSFEQDIRDGLHRRIKRLLPDCTIICLAPKFTDPDSFDHQFVMKQGQLSSVGGAFAQETDPVSNADLTRKLRALEGAHLFSGLARKQLRLLAFGARWFHAAKGEFVFRQGDDPSSGVFLLLEGQAELLARQEDDSHKVIATSKPGDLIGELGLIREEPRSLSMRAATDLDCLRIGADEFVAVIQNDAATAYKVLQVVARYV